MKIICISDNHGNEEVISKIKTKEYNADYYFHLGDSQMMQEDLRPFISVNGNNDFDFNLPNERIIDIGKHSLLLTHSHHYSGDIKLLYKQAKSLNCDVVLFGHTHEYFDEEINGIRFINPGSCNNNRYDKYPTYAIINIDDDNINVTKVEIK